MCLYFRRYIDRRIEAERLLDNLRNDAGRIVGDLIQDMNRITDRNITLIEDKLGDLQRILDAADRRIGLMKKEVKKEEAADRVYANIKGPLSPAAAVSPPPSPQSVEEDTEEETMSSSKVLDLYRKGLSPDIIAGTLDIPVGEVQLMIALQGRKGKSWK
jgi:hypothetical protein